MMITVGSEKKDFLVAKKHSNHGPNYRKYGT